jgi:hypothetical protein
MIEWKPDIFGSVWFGFDLIGLDWFGYYVICGAYFLFLFVLGFNSIGCWNAVWMFGMWSLMMAADYESLSVKDYWLGSTFWFGLVCGLGNLWCLFFGDTVKT